MGVKIGDVNNSASVNLKGEATSTTRSSQTLTLTVPNVDFSNGELVSIPVTAENFNEMIGFQFTMETNGLELESVASGALEMTEANVGSFAKENALTFSWNSVNDVTVNADEVLFTVVLRAKTNNDLNNTIELTSAITSAEAYTSTLEIANVELDVRNAQNVVETGFELYQNTPNPFDGLTTIPFNLPEDGNVTLNVYDITGKVVLQKRGTFTKGMNELRIEHTELNTRGIMYYQLEFNGVVATRKMISM